MMSGFIVRNECVINYVILHTVFSITFERQVLAIQWLSNAMLQCNAMQRNQYNQPPLFATRYLTPTRGKQFPEILNCLRLGRDHAGAPRPPPPPQSTPIIGVVFRTIPLMSSLFFYYSRRKTQMVCKPTDLLFYCISYYMFRTSWTIP